ncbi:cystine ABC transporter, ATP-binding protein [Lachnospiraceae bacterium KM106-2]|nr:cystine ABC transporter, ATP-binding protein [Lachnospiraceae bacterium KM106-2]
MYQVQDIKKSFGDVSVLKGVTLEIQPNKTTVLIGPSGSGKSTLLRCMNLLEIPDSGVVRLNGDSIDFTEKKKKMKMDHPSLRTMRKKTGMVFQNFQLFPHKTALQNIMEGLLVVQKQDKKTSEAEALELLRKVGLEEKRDSYPSELSGGQQQRIAIARALAMKPELLLFDEPTSALDPELEVEVLNLIRQLVDEKRTIVIVTHKMSFAREVADNIVFFDQGNIVKQGSYDELEKSGNERISQFLNMLQ